VFVKAALWMTLGLVASCPSSYAQSNPPYNSYFYVANTMPPDAFLSLRTEPTTEHGLNVMKMPNGTLLQVLQRRDDAWWYVRVVPSNKEGWALSGQGDRVWIECCLAASVEANAQTLPLGYSQAENAFMSMALDQRVKTQVLLTAAGYWPAVPTANF
jgi:hypothetical protein